MPLTNEQNDREAQGSAAAEEWGTGVKKRNTMFCFFRSVHSINPKLQHSDFHTGMQMSFINWAACEVENTRGHNTGLACVHFGFVKLLRFKSYEVESKYSEFFFLQWESSVRMCAWTTTEKFRKCWNTKKCSTKSNKYQSTTTNELYHPLSRNLMRQPNTHSVLNSQEQ